MYICKNNYFNGSLLFSGAICCTNSLTLVSCCPLYLFLCKKLDIASIRANLDKQ